MLGAVYQQTFATAFLNGARPALIVVMIAMAIGAAITIGLRGGRTAEEARQKHETKTLAAAS